MNAADESSVKRQDSRAKSEREQELIDLRWLLGTAAGRRFIWRLIGHCQVLSSIWEQSAKIHYNAGRQDVGHFLLAEAEAADMEAVFTMQRESRKREEVKNA